MLRISACFLLGLAAAPAAVRTTRPFDADWRFLKADAPGAEMPDFDDRAWRKLDVPHDWAIEGPFDEKNPSGQAGAYLPGGIGWYRKHFSLTAADLKRRVFVEFDGVMANSDVWINGFHLGKRPYGYVSFRYELTGHVTAANVLAVRADNSLQPASRWYAGAGIYRHVRLIAMNDVHLDRWATFVTTPNPTTVNVKTAVLNQSAKARTVTVQVTFEGQTPQQSEPRTIGAGKSVDFEVKLAVRNPRLWSLDHPDLYRAAVTVREGSTALDDETVPFGIREFHFDPETGFWLNGKNFKIKGVCLHGDAGALGVAAPVRVWERRLETLRQAGVNAIRTAHNPPAPEFLDLCDRMGFLVMDEMFDCWTVAKNKYDYHLYFQEWSKIDTRDTVRRDRNHPSIILYSAGNEIHDTPKPDIAIPILKGLVEVFHENDPTRPVTQALFRPNVSHDYDNGLADLLDVVGQNYRENEILAAHQQKPSRRIIGTENTHDRRVWLALRDNPPYAGQFLWAGIDYLGEAHAWPAVASYSGLLDRTGAFKSSTYERQSWWSDQPMVHIVRRVAPTQAAATDPGYETNVRRYAQTLFDDWSPANRASHEETVEVYSNCAEVELFLNGKSLGTKSIPADASARIWRVGFEPGVIEAVGRNQGKEAARQELRTAGSAVKVTVTTDRFGFVTATVVDENGTRVPDAAPLITFQLSGPGHILAVDNADNTSHEPFQTNQRHAFQGRAVAILDDAAQAGHATVTATAAGLQQFSAAAFGAKGDGATVDTAAIQRAIDAAAKTGGTVTFPQGVYLTGALFLKSGVHFRVDEGVTLRGVQDIAAYPIMPTRVAGIEMNWPAALINVYEQSNVKISGQGTVDGDGKIWWDQYWKMRREEYEPKGLRWAVDYDCKRPRLIQIYKSAAVDLADLNLQRPGFWTVHICYSNKVTVAGLTIRNNTGGRGPSTDGIDIDSSSDVLVEHCDIDCNDDAICLKAGRDADGLRVHRPSERILIRDNTVRGGAAGVTFGSETSGGIRDVEVSRLTVLKGVPNGILFKSASTRGGTIEKIDIHDVDLRGVGTAIAVTFNWNPSYSYARMPENYPNPPGYWRVLTEPVPPEKGLPHLRGVRIANLKGVDIRQAFSVVSYKESPLQDFVLHNIRIEAATAGSIANAGNWNFTDVVIQTADGSKPVMK